MPQGVRPPAAVVQRAQHVRAGVISAGLQQLGASSRTGDERLGGGRDPAVIGRIENDAPGAVLVALDLYHDNAVRFQLDIDVLGLRLRNELVDLFLTLGDRSRERRVWHHVAREHQFRVRVLVVDDQQTVVGVALA